MQDEPAIQFDLNNNSQKEKLTAQFSVHCHGNPDNKVYVHPRVRNLSGVLNFGGQGNEVHFGLECTFNGEIVSIDSGARTYIRGSQNVLNLQAFVYEKGILDIGLGVIAYGVRVWVTGGTTLSIGDKCLFADGITIRTTDHHSVFDMNTCEVLNHPASIAIADRVWVGQDVSIWKGSSIGRGAIIGAKSLVNRAVPEFELWSGVPAKMLRQRVSWLDPNPASAEQVHDRMKELGL